MVSYCTFLLIIGFVKMLFDQKLLTNMTTDLVINPLSPELPQHGVSRPGAPRHNIISNRFFSKFPRLYLSFMGINQKPTSRFFSLTGKF